jgi:hypothetical protein
MLAGLLSAGFNTDLTSLSTDDTGTQAKSFGWKDYAKTALGPVGALITRLYPTVPKATPDQAAIPGDNGWMAFAEWLSGVPLRNFRTGGGASLEPQGYYQMGIAYGKFQRLPKAQKVAMALGWAKGDPSPSLNSLNQPLPAKSGFTKSGGFQPSGGFTESGGFTPSGSFTPSGG